MSNDIKKVQHKGIISNSHQGSHTVRPGIEGGNCIHHRKTSLDIETNWIPAGLNVLQIVEPLTSTSLPDHTGCSEDSCEVTN
jgi:hypothetical protein